MKFEPIDGGLKKLKSDLSKMTLKEKLHHLWEYYKSVLVILAVFVAICSIFVTSCRTRNTETLISGLSINIQLDEEGQAYVRDDYFEKIKTQGLQQVIYNETFQEKFSAAINLEDSYMGLMNLIAICVSEELDYLILDKIALENLIAHEIYGDLREIFTEEELAAFGDRVIWAEMGTEEGQNLRHIPIALKVQDDPFFKERAKNKTDIYFAIVTNSPRKEQIRQFWEYLQAWTPAAE